MDRLADPNSWNLIYRWQQGFVAQKRPQWFLDVFPRQILDEPTVSEGRANGGFSGSQVSLAGRKDSLQSTKPETEPMESQKTFKVEVETKTEEPEEPNHTASDHDARESLTPQQSEDQFSLFSSQLFEHEVYKDSPASSIGPNESDSETLTATVPTAGSSTSQDAEPSTSTEDSNTSSGKGFWDKARQLASQRRRSRLEHNLVLSKTDGKITSCVISCLKCSGTNHWMLSRVFNQSTLDGIRKNGNATTNVFRSHSGALLVHNTLLLHIIYSMYILALSSFGAQIFFTSWLKHTNPVSDQKMTGWRQYVLDVQLRSQFPLSSPRERKREDPGNKVASGSNKSVCSTYGTYVSYKALMDQCFIGPLKYWLSWTYPPTDSLQFRHADRFKQADEYRMAWIAGILRGSKSRGMLNCTSIDQFRYIIGSGE